MHNIFGKKHATFLSVFLLLFLITPVAHAALTLKAEVNPGPAEPGELLDVQISVASTSSTGNLTLRVLWPAEIDQFPYTTGGGGCSGSCDTGEYLVWDLGTLGPGGTITVGFNEHTESFLSDGTFSLDIQLLEGGVIQETLSKEIEVLADSPLELSIDPLTDPVASDGTLVYEIVYSNTSVASSESTTLNFSVPAGTQFADATGGGVFSGGTVTWNLGSLAPGSGGRVRLIVDVNPVANGTLLEAAGTITGTINFQAREARAEAVCRVDDENLELALEINPDPVGADELLDAQIRVSNLNGSVTGDLTLRVLWPSEIDQFPYVAGGGACSGSCDTGEYLIWNLGVLGPGVTRTFSFNEHAESWLVPGQLIPVEIELLEADLPARNVSHTAITLTDSPLEIFVDPLNDPVPSAGTLTYEIVYSNAGSASAENAVLSFPIPAGTTFQSATGGGTLLDGMVRWNLGSLAPNSGHRERVTVNLDALANGTLLVVDSALLTGTINFRPQESRATAVSRVGAEALALALEVNPDPPAPDELLDAQVSVSNLTGSVTGDLTLRVLWPSEIDQFPYITGGGICSGSCDTGEYLIWSLGPLGPGVTRVVSFNEHAESWLVDGQLIPIEVELLEGGLPARHVSHTAMALTDSPLEIFVDPLADPVPSGGTLTYDITFGNTGSDSVEDAVVRFPLADGTQFQSATGGGMNVGNAVTWSLGTVAPNSGGQLQVMTTVDALPDSTLLTVDSATFDGTVGFQAKSSRASAVSRVDTETLELDVTLGPNPVTADELVTGDLTISNPTGSATGNLTLRVLWPAEIDQFPGTTGGGSCSGSCDTGEYLSWSLGSLGPGGSVLVGFSEETESFLVNGRLIPIEIELLNGGLPAQTFSQTLLTSPGGDDDNDGDGIADVLDPDDDNDGMPDGWEITHGLNPFNAADANQDPDGDGLNNLGEFLLGSDPNVADYVFADGFESGSTSAWSATP